MQSFSSTQLLNAFSSTFVGFSNKNNNSLLFLSRLEATSLNRFIVNLNSSYSSQHLKCFLALEEYIHRQIELLHLTKTEKQSLLALTLPTPTLEHIFRLLNGPLVFLSSDQEKSYLCLQCFFSDIYHSLECHGVFNSHV